MKKILLLMLLAACLTGCPDDEQHARSMANNDPDYPHLTDAQVAEYRNKCTAEGGTPNNFVWYTNEHIGQVQRVECDWDAKPSTGASDDDSTSE